MREAPRGASFFLWFAVMIVRKMFDLSGGAELPDIFFGSFGSNMKTLSNGEIRAAVEFRRKIIEKRLA